MRDAIPWSMVSLQLLSSPIPRFAITCKVPEVIQYLETRAGQGGAYLDSVFLLGLCASDDHEGCGVSSEYFMLWLQGGAWSWCMHLSHLNSDGSMACGTEVMNSLCALVSTCSFTINW